MEKIRVTINDNYIAANRFIERHQPYIYIIWGIYLSFVIMAFAADYALSFSFFSKIHENEMGQLTVDKILIVALKSVLPLAVAVSMKFIFVEIPKDIQRFLFWALLIFAFIIAINIGRSQMRPMLIEAMDTLFPTPIELPGELNALFSEDEFNVIKDTRIETGDVNDYDPKEQLNKQKSKFHNEFKYYGYAFLMITAFGVLSWIKLSKIITNIRKINQLKKTIIQPYNDLKQKEKQLSEMKEQIKHLELHKPYIYRSFQDIVVKAYLGGLVVPKTNIEDLKIFGDFYGNSRKYPFFQIYLRKAMPYVNVDTLSEMIEKADKSVDDLCFINAPQELTENKKLKVLSS